MVIALKIAIWNANGFCQHVEEVKAFLLAHKIDIMLISETHMTTKSHVKIPNYCIYTTEHPSGRAHGGTAVIIRSNIQHYETIKYEHDHLQATSVVLEDYLGALTISAVYCPPKHHNKEKHYADFFNTLGKKFIAGGDYNAKHPLWGSRVTTPKGRELVKAMRATNTQYISTGQPTYWPTDVNRIPDVIDFCIVKGVDLKKITTESCLDLSSDHSPIILSIHSQTVKKEIQPSLFNKKTNWHLFREKLDTLIDLKLPLKTEDDIDNAVNDLTKHIQNAAWYATPDITTERENKSLPPTVKELIAKKRLTRKQWQHTRSPEHKQRLNKLTKELTKTLSDLKNERIKEYLESLTATEATDYSLWKATRKLKRPQQRNPPIRDDDNQWARNDKQKAELFAKHLEKVFTPLPPAVPPEEDNAITRYLESPNQLAPPIRKIKISETKNMILKEIHPTKAPGFDLVTGKVLREMSENCFVLITYIFNAILRTSYFPTLWKVSQIIMIPKPGKKLEDVTSYRPISLLPVLSKVFEKLYLKRLRPVLENLTIIPDYQFGFRKKHGTIEQVHRLVKQIYSDLESKKYCSAAFLDVSQAFDKVWHKGLRYKLKKNLPLPHFQLLQSYLHERFFLIKYNTAYTNLHPIGSGVPQGSVLGPILYLLYTSDLPTTINTTIATFADDTAILASHPDPIIASSHLQTHLNNIQPWLNKWRIKVNEAKSVHVTFTMRKGSCPAVQLNNCLLPQADDVKYLGLHLDRRLTWRKHIVTKRKQLGLKLNQLYWLLGRNSQLRLENKILLYKTMLRPVWTYGIQLWGSTADSNIEIIQRFQNKIMRTIVNAPWYVPNRVIQRDIPMPSVRKTIKNFSVKHTERLANHPNTLANNLLVDTCEVRRLKKKFRPSDLETRFRLL